MKTEIEVRAENVASDSFSERDECEEILRNCSTKAWLRPPSGKVFSFQKTKNRTTYFEVKEEMSISLQKETLSAERESLDSGRYHKDSEK